MALKDLLRPKWKHSELGKRLTAIETLTDQVLIAEIAKTDTNGGVRKAAWKKIPEDINPRATA